MNRASIESAFYLHNSQWATLERSTQMDQLHQSRMLALRVLEKSRNVRIAMVSVPGQRMTLHAGQFQFLAGRHLWIAILDGLFEVPDDHVVCNVLVGQRFLDVVQEFGWNGYVRWTAV